LVTRGSRRFIITLNGSNAPMDTVSVYVERLCMTRIRGGFIA